MTEDKETHSIPIIEEQYDNRGTGVEEEEVGEQELVRPWDPNKIRVDTRPFSLRNVLDMVDDEDLELEPEFQRRKVWSSLQKSQLIESILLRIPLPAFYFSSNDEGKFQVVDGLQRISTIYEFMRGGADKSGGFRLSNLEYLTDQVGKKKYRELDGTVWSRRLNTAQIMVNVVDPQTPDAVKFDIFRRINTGGTPLSQQEIRHCMSRKRSRQFLALLADDEAFHIATGNALKNHKRMADREVALRYCGFASTMNLSSYASMAELLNDTTRQLDLDFNDEKLKELETGFHLAMINAYAIFGEYAFRKWPSGSDQKNPICRPLFEVWSVLLSRIPAEKARAARSFLVPAFRKALTKDVELLQSISYTTGDPEKVRIRFSKIEHLLEEAGLDPKFVS